MKSALTHNRPLRLTLYILFFLIWLLAMTVPCFAFALAARGELSWERGEHDRDRIWLIQERKQKGLGYQAERLITDQSSTNGPVCVRASVRYFLWEGSSDGQNSDYCECLNPTGAPTEATCP